MTTPQTASTSSATTTHAIRMPPAMPPFSLRARARECFGNDAVERLYVALGQARHERKESLADAVVIEKALIEAGSIRPGVPRQQQSRG